MALPLLSGVKLKCDHHTLCPSPENDDTWVVEDVVHFEEVPSTKGRRLIPEMACQVERTPGVDMGDQGPVFAPPV